MSFEEESRLPGVSNPEANMHRHRQPAATYFALDVATPTTTRQGLQAVVDEQIGDNASPFGRWYELHAVGNIAQVKTGDVAAVVTLNTDGVPIAVGTPMRFWLGTPAETGFIVAGKVTEPFIIAHGLGAGSLAIRVLT